jgi:hypothetical protein
MGPDSWDEDTRTLDLVWSTGADVTRADPWSSKRYVERLSMDPAHIRAERLNAGAPLLDTHRSHGAANVVGNVVPGSDTAATAPQTWSETWFLGLSSSLTVLGALACASLTLTT